MFDLLNKQEAEKQQQRLFSAVADFKNSLVTLVGEAKALHTLRVKDAATAIHGVDRLVCQFANKPQYFPKVIKQFWAEEQRLQAAETLEQGLTAVAKVNDESMAAALGLSAAVVQSTFLSGSMLTSVSGPTVRTVLGLLSRSTATYGISSGAVAGLARALGTGLGARVVAGPTLVVPLLGQILAAGLLVWSAWDLYDTAKKNAAMARKAVEARAKVEIATQQLQTQNEYLRYLKEKTAEFVTGISTDLKWLDAQGALGKDYRTLSAEVKDHMCSLINKVQSLSELLCKTADDTMAEAQAEASKQGAA